MNILSKIFKNRQPTKKIPRPTNQTEYYNGYTIHLSSKKSLSADLRALIFDYAKTELTQDHDPITIATNIATASGISRSILVTREKNILKIGIL